MKKSTASRRFRTSKPGYGPSSSPRIKLVTVEQRPSTQVTTRVDTEHDVAMLARQLLATKDREHFVVLHLDGSHQLASFETAFIGSLTQCPVHPREVFKAAILANAKSIICIHNHPSGDTSPSSADHTVFDTLREAGQLLGIPLLDFLIVSSSSHWAAKGTWF